VTGAVVISHFLQHWVGAEALRLRRQVRILSVPILVDPDELPAATTSTPVPSVLFAGAPAYHETIQFILAAMAVVWQRHPTCRLVITGCDLRDPASTWLVQSLAQHPHRDQVELAGYLPRRELLLRYTRAWALLIPLFADTRSMARFPTKIGEYLASGRPVVTNAVGEINYFLEDGVSAYVCAPSNPMLYGLKIIEALADPLAASAIGACGQRVAAQHFRYSSYGRALYEFVHLK
jgi:glycosyltransferase involved in cell wall biosynthesis